MPIWRRKHQLCTTTDFSMTEPPTGTAAAGLPTLPVSVVLEVAREPRSRLRSKKGNVVAERFHLGLEGGRMENGGTSQGSSVTASAPRHRLGTRPRIRRPESATPAGCACVARTTGECQSRVPAHPSRGDKPFVATAPSTTCGTRRDSRCTRSWQTGPDAAMATVRRAAAGQPRPARPGGVRRSVCVW